MAIPLILIVEHALRDAGIPIDGVGIGDPSNRATWRAFYSQSATPAQKAQGDALLLSLDPLDATTIANVKADISQAGANEDVLRAVVQGIWEAIPGPALTLAQLRARILQIYRGLL